MKTTPRQTVRWQNSKTKISLKQLVGLYVRQAEEEDGN